MNDLPMPSLPAAPGFAVVLVHPEIPPNTGNVIRLTANTATELHLVEPLGFRMDDRELKRAGLDYHEYASVRVHPRLRRLPRRARKPRSAALVRVHDAERAIAVRRAIRAGRRAGVRLRIAGLPAAVLAHFAPGARLRIPMRPGVRSLNLSNAVAVAVYEAWRQTGFAGAG